jgi:uncharacterized membrane protein YjdF
VLYLVKGVINIYTFIKRHNAYLNYNIKPGIGVNYGVTRTKRLFEIITMKYKIIIACMCLFSCGSNYDCDLVANAYKNDECLLIVKEIPGKRDGKFDYKGIHLFNKNECNCNSQTSD